MADGLKLSQLAGLTAGMAQGPATFNPVQKALTDYLSGSAQSMIAAEAQKKAAKKAKKKIGIGQILGAAGSIAAAPFTGGASLAYLPAAMSAGSAIDSAVSGDWGSAVTNTANAVGGGYGASKALSAPLSNIAPMDRSIPQMLGETMESPAAARASLAGAPQSDAKANVWENASGGAANRAVVSGIANMSRRDLRKAFNNDDEFGVMLRQYLDAGGTLSRKQAAAIPLGDRRSLRSDGYAIPGPFGLY